MRIEQNKSPTQLEVIVRCNSCGKEWNPTVTSLIHQKHWCGRCTDSRVYSYMDILELVKLVTLSVIGKEGILKKPTNQEDFKLLANKYIPSQIPLTIECGNCGNKINYTAQYLRAWIFPCQCINLKYETILRWYFYKIFKKHFNHTSLSNIIPNYSGRLEYDGFNKLVIDDNYITKDTDKKCVVDETFLSKTSNCEAFEFNQSEIDFFIESYQNDEFASNDIISIILPFGLLQFIYEDNGLKLIKSQIYKKNQILILSGEIEIAFEFNGRQHYEFPNAFHKKLKDFLTQTINDLKKLNLSNQHNIFLFIFPYWIDLKMDNPQKIQNFIIKTFDSKLGLNLSSLPQYDHRNVKFGQYRLDKFDL